MTYQELINKINHCIGIGNFVQAMSDAHVLLDEFESGTHGYVLTNVFKDFTRFFLNVPDSMMYITYMRRLIKLFEASNQPIKQVDTMYILMMDYINANELDLAYLVCSEAMTIAEAKNHQIGKANLFNGLGNMAEHTQELDKALAYYHDAYLLSNSIAYQKGKRFAHNIGIVYRKLGRFSQAVEYLSIAYEYNSQHTTKGIFANTCNEYANALLSFGDFQLAEMILEEGFVLCVESNSQYFLRENHQIRSELYQKQGMFEKALHHYQEFYKLGISINRRKLENELRLFNYRAELALKDEEHDLVIQKNKELKRYSEVLKDKNNELSDLLQQLRDYKNQLTYTTRQASFNRMLIGISHQINTALGNSTLLTTFLKRETERIEKLLKDSTLGKNDFSSYLIASHKSLDTILENQRQVTHFIDKIRETPFTINQLKQSISLDELFELCMEKNHFLLESNHVKVTVINEKPLPFIKGPDVLIKIFSELLDNVFKYAFKNQENPEIILKAKFDMMNGLILTFTDNGCGIADDDLKNIFDPFFTSDMGSSGGDGMGLYFVSKMIHEVLEGSIVCQSEVQKGTTFIIKLPDNGISFSLLSAEKESPC